MRRTPLVNYTDYSEEELLQMKRVEACEGLPEKAQKFCEAYVEGYNYKTALIKAGYKGDKAVSSFGRRILMNANAQRYVCWLKTRTLKTCMVNARDLVDQWVRIAFADISDFVKIHPGYIELKPNEEIDGSLIKSIKSGKYGVSIELYDKLKALDSLANYISDMPKQYKQVIEERKMDLLEQEFELKKKLSELEVPEKEDDGFMEAIKGATEAVWRLNDDE